MATNREMTIPRFVEERKPVPDTPDRAGNLAFTVGVTSHADLFSASLVHLCAFNSYLFM